jgi:hypothetical protein
MLRSVIPALALAFALPACMSSTIRSQEGQPCSTSSSDDSQRVCTPAQDLVCISTYKLAVMNPTEAAKFDGGLRQVYLCRLACNNSDECPEQNDVCCHGNIYGKTYSKIGGCTPPASCDPSMVLAGDGGTEEDTAVPADVGADLGPRPADVATPARDGGSPSLDAASGG